MKNKNFKLYALAGSTILDADKVDSIKCEIPTRNQIYQHVMEQSKKDPKDFQFIDIEVSDESHRQILRDMTIKSGVKLPSNYVVYISIQDNKHPIVALRKRVITKEVVKEAIVSEEVVEEVKS